MVLEDGIVRFSVGLQCTLFTTSNPCFDEGISDLVGEVITVEGNASLCLIPGEAEIFLAISELGLNKAPGLDGMTGLFHKSYWPIVKTSKKYWTSN
jgi:hypothetical protein